MAPGSWVNEERRALCTAHQAMEEHDRRTDEKLSEIREETRDIPEIKTNIKLIRWFAVTLLVAMLGSCGTTCAIIYYSGTIVQTVKTNTTQIEKLSNKFDRHNDRDNWSRTP